MALRVLLADESVSIKKVMQLALQDYGVEVKSVGNGADVGPVAQSFGPDIAFVDVLLSKKSGYDVCSELKKNTQLNNLPVVLMWSGFLEIDPEKARQAQADAQLEKPFDAESLRNLIRKLVPRLTSNEIAPFVRIPSLPEFVEERPLETKDFEEPEEFQQVPLPRMSSSSVSFQQPQTSDPETDEGWAHQDLSKYKIHLPEKALDDFNSESDSLGAGIGPASSSEDFVSSAPEASHSRSRALSSSLTFSPQINPPPAVDVDPQLTELILREKAPDVLREMAWKLMPEIVERVVREELQKLLKQAEKFE